MTETKPLTGATLAELRRDRGMTQEALAARMGWHLSRVSHIERRDGWLTSTLMDYLTGIGGDVRIAVDDAGTVYVEDMRRFHAGMRFLHNLREAPNQTASLPEVTEWMRGDERLANMIVAGYLDQGTIKRVGTDRIALKGDAR